MLVVPIPSTPTKGQTLWEPLELKATLKESLLNNTIDAISRLNLHHINSTLEPHNSVGSWGETLLKKQLALILSPTRRSSKLSSPHLKHYPQFQTIRATRLHANLWKFHPHTRSLPGLSCPALQTVKPFCPCLDAESADGRTL